MIFLNLDSPRVAFRVINFEKKKCFSQIIIALNTFGKTFLTRNKSRFCPKVKTGAKETDTLEGRQEARETAVHISWEREEF